MAKNDVDKLHEQKGGGGEEDGVVEGVVENKPITRMKAERNVLV